MRKRKPKESQTVTIAPEPQPKPSKNSTFARTKAQQEKALAKFPLNILIGVTAERRIKEGDITRVTKASEITYPPGCNGLYDALSAFESRRSNEREERRQAERAEQYELAKGTEQRNKPRGLSDCKKVLQKTPQDNSQKIKTINHPAKQPEEIPPLEELTRA